MLNLAVVEKLHGLIGVDIHPAIPEYDLLFGSDVEPSLLSTTPVGDLPEEFFRELFGIAQGVSVYDQLWHYAITKIGLPADNAIFASGENLPALTLKDFW